MKIRLQCALGLLAGILTLCPAVGCAASPSGDASRSTLSEETAGNSEESAGNSEESAGSSEESPGSSGQTADNRLASAQGSDADGGAKQSAKSTQRSTAAPTGPIPDTWHATTFVSGGMGIRLIYYWSKADWMRAETVANGHPIVTIVRDQDYVGFDRLTGRGVRVRRSPDAIREDANRSRPFGNDLDEVMKEGAVKVEESTRSGIDVEIWRITDDQGRRKLWVTSAEPRLPMRLENFIRSAGDTITTDYSDWTRGLEIPDAFFEAPANVQLEEFDYQTFIKASAERSIGPILYPDLLHGTIAP